MHIDSFVLGEVLFSCLRRQEAAYAAEPIKTSECGFSELVLLQKCCVPHLGSATCIIVTAVPESCFHSVVTILAPHTRRIFTFLTSRCLKPNHSSLCCVRASAEHPSKTTSFDRGEAIMALATRDGTSCKICLLASKTCAGVCLERQLRLQD